MQVRVSVLSRQLCLLKSSDSEFVPCSVTMDLYFNSVIMLSFYLTVQHHYMSVLSTEPWRVFALVLLEASCALQSYHSVAVSILCLTELPELLEASCTLQSYHSVPGEILCLTELPE